MSNDRETLFEVARIVYNAGMFKELPAKIQQVISEDEELVKFLTTQEAPSLDLRLSCMEYEKHIFRLFEANMSEEYFFRTIVKIVYMMMLCEKNPMVANQLRESINDKKLSSEFLRLIGD